MSGITNKPSGGWIHCDKLIAKQGITYTVKYVGCLEVKASMKTLDYNTRSSVARECINRVCEAAGLKTADKRRRIDKNVEKAIAEVPNMSYAGTNVSLTVSSSKLSLTSLDTHQVISSHDMPQISFASGGDCDSLDFVAYVAKDSTEWRACYVLECGGGLTKDVIATIGQAFDLRFKQYMKPSIMALAAVQPSTSGGDADKDYYNDLPGKVPPDVGPPPVPPLPAVVPPFTTLPPVQSPNLIDLNADIPSHRDLPIHNYVNDNMVSTRGRDVFDMHPFAAMPLSSNVSCPKKIDSKHLAQLQNEVWFHGQISRGEAEKLLERDGDFLVRESPNSEAQFVLSGMQDNTKKHLLLIDPEGVVRTKDRMFDSVSHLINFHCENALPIISSESALVLRVPIPRMT
ncbi:hypothetical protein WA026_010325 [Henosepilachna vigintioctopunctata]|uniref:SHC-transforming protein 1 n=1 Tax=Henosepilachna vigintioctopunctata TaxID=420089 RepID=A0AAW1V3G9_9CUCU